jgi:hypothetical protein
MTIVGVVVGMVAWLATIAYAYDREMSWVSYLGVFTLLALAPAIALWLTRNRYWRGFAAGMTACWVAGLLLEWVDNQNAGDSPEEIARVMQEVIDSGVPAYYFGEDADGHGLSWVDSSGNQVQFNYGCHDYRTGDESDCQPDAVSLTKPVFRWSHSRDRCERLDPVLGVPTILLFNELTLFTGTSMVTIEAYNVEDPDPALALTLAGTLRPVGQSETATSLPPPEPEVLAFLKKKCGPRP